MDDFPLKLTSTVYDYLREHEGSKVFHYDAITTTPYKDKSITKTNYRVYALYGNLFEVFRYSEYSKPEWNLDEVENDSMVAWEIKMCYEKSDLFK